MTKKIKILLAILLLIVINSTLIINCVQAANLSNEKVYEIDYCDKVLKYRGVARGAVYVIYEDNEKGTESAFVYSFQSDNSVPPRERHYL